MSESKMQSCVLKFYSQLNEFRSNDRHTDVTIVFEDESFKCHRVVLSAASKYFDALFFNDFKDSNCDKVTGLKAAMEAVTFKEILQYFYTGRVQVTSSNAYDLLRASEFLGLQDVEDLCITFIKENIPVQNMAEVYEFACATKKTLLTDFLHPHVIEVFEEFSRTVDFLKMPFNALVSMLNQCTSTKDDAMLLAIIRWVNHNCEERLQYVDTLNKSIQVTNLSIPFLRSLMVNFTLSDARVNKFQELEKSCSPQEAITDKSSLLVYMNLPQNNMTNVFSVSSHSFDCSFLCQMTSSNMRGVALSNGVVCNLDCSSSDLKFYACASIDMMHKDKARSLSNPLPMLIDIETNSRPTFGNKNLELCVMKQNNTVYLYDREFRATKLPPATSRRPKIILNNDYNERIVIYSYSFEHDHWSSALYMNHSLYEASVAVFKDTLYFIGGRNSRNSTPAGYVQAYDYCKGWRELPTSHHCYTLAKSCALNGKIYVCSMSGENCEVYNIEAATWDFIEPVNLDANYAVQKMISFSDKVWLFATAKNKYGIPENFRVYLYDPVSNKWSNYSMLNRIVERTSWRGCYVNDAVVFESL